MVKQQDSTIFDDIAAHRPFLYRLAVLELQNHAAAEDVTQEAIAAALENVARFERRSSVKTWLLSILRFKVLDAFRDQKRLTAMADMPGLEHELDVSDFDGLFEENGCWATAKDPWSDPQTNYQQLEFLRVLDACLTNLPHNSARVFLMREWLEVASAEICEKLKITPGNLRVLLYRARMQLRVCLDKNWTDNDAI